MSDDAIRELIQGATSVGLWQTVAALQELLAARAELTRLRAERDAAVAEAVRVAHEQSAANIAHAMQQHANDVTEAVTRERERWLDVTCQCSLSDNTLPMGICRNCQRQRLLGWTQAEQQKIDAIRRGE